MKSSANKKTELKEIKPEIKPEIKKIHFKSVGRIVFWFSIGALISLFLISSFSYLAFQKYYEGKIYPGVSVNGVDFSNKTEAEVKQYFTDQNNIISNANFVFKFEEKIASVSARDIDFGYDDNLLTTQAVGIGRSKDPFTGMGTIARAYFNGINLSPSFRYSEDKLDKKLESLYKEINKAPVEAVFNFQDGRVTEFRPSENGRRINEQELSRQVLLNGSVSAKSSGNQTIIISVPVETLSPTLTTDKINEMGITELIGTGTSTYKGSIENRIFNLSLAASRLNGVLVKPGEEFSFNNTIGDVSSLTGYKQAYVIQNGRTVLGDGGGVCQVSTTFFRALLNTGLPITERNQHAYRVSYYEQDSSPGIDAAIYTPNVDLKFKNDTGHHILIQTVLDPNEQKLTFMLYGTSDGRVSEMTTPVITNQSPAPEAKFEDDPNLPAGIVKQVDFAASGARTEFSRTVTRDGEVILTDKFVSNYRPWQAVFMRGTKTE